MLNGHHYLIFADLLAHLLWTNIFMVMTLSQCTNANKIDASERMDWVMRNTTDNKGWEQQSNNLWITKYNTFNWAIIIYVQIQWDKDGEI